jgi:hypothetical protein
MMFPMRTTITLDPDLYAQLRTLARERGISFKEAVNTAVRRGIGEEKGRGSAYTVRARPMGLRSGVDLTKALRLAGELEDAETIRKLELRK